MNFLELAKKRCSVRDYSPRTVEQEKLDYILECARMAPSAVNYQPWRFIVVQHDDCRKIVEQSYSREWFAKAPLYIVAYAKTSEAWIRKYDGKIMPILTWPSPWNTFVWLLPNRVWAVVGSVISM